jgi:hypothetical protein
VLYVKHFTNIQIILPIIQCYEWYTDDTFGMPGEQFLNGTISGAMKAADKLYPPPDKINELDIFQQLMKLMGSDR